jgi:flagellar capping protein FliD
MNITDSYNASQANVMLGQIYSRQISVTPTESTKEVDKIKKAFESADLRVQQKSESTKEQISSMGKLKSSLADTQAASRDVQKLKPNASAADMAAAAEKMVKAYNSTQKAAVNSEAQSGNSAEASNARRVGNDLKRSASNGGLTSELQKAGVSQNQDGTLKIDAEKFKAAAASDPAALRKALEKVGQKIEASSTKALSDKSDLNTALKALKDREVGLEARRVEQQTLASTFNQKNLAMAAAYRSNATS